LLQKAFDWIRKKFPIFPFCIALFLFGCASSSTPVIDIENIRSQEQLDFSLQIAEADRNLTIKENILGQYSIFGMAMFAVGCGILAFSPFHRSGGFIFIAGGSVAMASLWLFDSEWFPWIAGGTAVIAISLMIYSTVSRSSNLSAECNEQTKGESPPKS
jgi:hypothetical protein